MNKLNMVAMMGVMYGLINVVDMAKATAKYQICQNPEANTEP